MLFTVDAFVPASSTPPRRLLPLLYDTKIQEEQKEEAKACYYRAPITNEWRPRIHINDLDVGQHLNGTVVQELLEGKTGPKLFFDVGVARKDSSRKWQICNGMMRLGFGKQSVTRKRATRLRRKALVELVVSRIYPESGRFEVVTADSIIPEIPKQLVPASTLEPKQELVGTVTRVLPFGVFVDVGANRRGLLHIQKVADLYQRYIDKEKGLEEAGLERGARIRVAVVENKRKRLFLDFTDDVKQQAAQEEEVTKEAETTVVETKVESAVESISQESAPVVQEESSSEEEAAAWAAYAGMEQDEAYVYEDDEDDGDYDEDKDIEDALGLGSY